MAYLLLVIAQHGYLVIFAVALGEAMGLPLPASVALIAGGAAVASGVLRAPIVFLLAITALLLGDSITYLLGRYTGWALLGFLCKVSVNPETCILRSTEMFYKRGKTTLLIAKFIPGINTMAAPLAGSMRMPLREVPMARPYGSVALRLGFWRLGVPVPRFSCGDSARSRHRRACGGGRCVTSSGGLCRLSPRVYRKGRIYRVVPRVQVEELALKLDSEEAEKIMLVDVRSHGYYDRGAARIQGSIRIEPNNLTEEIKTLPKDKDIYLYCT